MSEYKIRGLREVEANLNREIKKIRGASMAGILEAAALILEDCDKTPPLIPVDKGVLRASRFITPVDQINPKVRFGFSANYGAYVHEMTDERYGKKINWSRPSSGPKFLEASMKRNSKEVLKRIQNKAKLI